MNNNNIDNLFYLMTDEKCPNIFVSNKQILNLAEYLSKEVESIKYGHWIYSGDEESYDDYYINCSCCGKQFYAYDRNNERQDSDRCPCCGAKMTRKEEI